MRIHFVLILLVAAVMAASAQSTRVGGPVSGIVFDARTHALRPMLGVPGAAYLGGSLLDGVDVAAVSPDGDHALAVVEGRLLSVSGLSTGAAATVAVDGAISAIDRIAWSADGNYAAVSSAAAAQGLRQGAAGPAIDLAMSLTALAVGADGEVLAGAEGGVYLLAPGSAPRRLATLERPAALAVRGTLLYAADAASGQVWLIANYATSAAPELFAAGLDTPVGVSVSADGKRVLVASSGAKTVTAFDAATRSALREVSLDVAPSELMSFGGRDVWLLNSAAGDADPLYVATGGDEPAAWFVPAGREQ